MLKNFDFTTLRLEELLKFFQKNDINTYTLQDWIELNPSKGVLIRNDVDRKPKNSLNFARIYNKYGIKGTFNFRIKKTSFNKKIVKDIASLNHEIGYHYEDLSDSNGDMKQAIKKFKENLKSMRQLTNINTITMHGSPLSSYDNRDMCKNLDFEELDLKGEGYLSINFENIYYFTDTGRTWGSTFANVRDKAFGSKIPEYEIKSTIDLKNYILKNKNQSFVLVFHPERWSSNMSQLFFSYLLDLISSLVKVIIKILKK